MTAAELVRTVSADAESVDDAVERIVQAIESDAGLLRGWWDQYGEGQVRSMVRQHRKKRPSMKHGRKVAKARAPTRSWRDSIRERPETALDVELPVNGRSVAIRDLTRRDIQFIEDGYRGLAHIAGARAERWGRIRSRLNGPDDTG